MREQTAPEGAQFVHALIDSGAVLAWGMPQLRDLPWRRVRDPWAILVAEVMLQQTQGRRVIPKWEAFTGDYPTPAALAHAALGDVLRRWQGLGYPRRARNLQLAATMMVESHDGIVPDVLDDLLTLPGVGPYTARAVMAFAFERDVAVVDTNIARVLARTAGCRLTTNQAQSMADELVPAGEGWAWNQIFMDLGAVVCRPDPNCDECPLRSACRWFAAGRVDPDPATGSAGVSRRQAPFEGSDRQARGRLLAALGRGPLVASELDGRILEGLVADGLVAVAGDVVTFPGSES
jgi:A/G-specific adenine glycosylase